MASPQRSFVTNEGVPFTTTLLSRADKYNHQLEGPLLENGNFCSDYYETGYIPELGIQYQQYKDYCSDLFLTIQPFANWVRGDCVHLGEFGTPILRPDMTPRTKRRTIAPQKAEFHHIDVPVPVTTLDDPILILFLPYASISLDGQEEDGLKRVKCTTHGGITSYRYLQENTFSICYPSK